MNHNSNDISIYYINKNTNKKGNNGFTLIELIVTLVVLGIMMSLSAMGILAWQDWSRFNQANEYAQTLFVAGQNQLTDYSASGSLEEFTNRLQNSGILEDEVDLDSIYYEEDKNYSKNSVWITKYKGKVCYAKCEKGDYSKYMDDKSSVSASAKIVFELLEDYVYDTSILNNAICVEFSAEEGQMFSVSFSDANESFTYESTDALRGIVSISNRWEAYRKDRMIGYYGVNTLSAHVNYGKPVISSVKLNNEETLNLTFKLSKLSSAMNLLTYDIDVYDKNDSSNPVMRIVLEGSKIKNYKNRSEISSNIIRYKKENGKIIEEALGEVPILAWFDDNHAINIVLDAADFQATSKLFTDEFDVLQSATMKTSSFAKTYSFHRFGLDTEQIFCSVKCRGKNYKTSAAKISNSSYVYFADQEKTDSINNSNLKVETTKYKIKNARHLYNIRYVEDVCDNYSNDIKKYVSGLEGDLNFFTYEVSEDIDWNEFLASKNFYNSKGAISFNVNEEYIKFNAEPSIKSFSKCYFPSIKRLRAGDSFVSNDKTMSNLAFAQICNDLHNLYIDDVTNNDAKVIKPVGLFASNYGTINGITLDDVAANGEYHVGSLCGNNSGILSNNTILNSNNKSVISGKENVGGISGYNIGVKDDIYLSELDEPVISYEKNENNALVKGDYYIGGLFGSIYLPDNCDINLVINECNNKGVLEVNSNTNKDEAGYIGGITGYLGNYYSISKVEEKTIYDFDRIIISNCSNSTPYRSIDYDAFVDNKINDDDKQLLKGYYVGGIVGFNFNSTIINCGSLLDDNDNPSSVYGYRYVGGIVGFNKGLIKASTIDSDFDKNLSKNYSEVIGSEYVGGITGCNCDFDDSLLDLSKDDFDIKDSFVDKPDNDINLHVKTEDYVNLGDVYAYENYAGAISGYNLGWIYNAISKKDNEDENYSKVYSHNYAGGVVGYNNGILGNTKRDISDDSFEESVVNDGSLADIRRIVNDCYVVGKNYVGGIVGYNDENSIIEDYCNGKGYVRGIKEDGYFVGGFAGFNSSVDLLMSNAGQPRTLKSDSKDIQGGYFVGGYIGANIINTNNYKKNGGVTPSVSAEETTEETTEEVTEETNAQLAEDNNSFEQLEENNNSMLSANTDKVMFTFGFVDSWGTDNRIYTNFQSKLLNVSNNTLKNWRVEIDIDDGTYFLTGSNGNFVIDQNKKKLIINNVDYNVSLYPEQTIIIWYQLVFDNKELLEKFQKKHYVIYADNEKVGEGNISEDSSDDGDDKDEDDEVISESDNDDDNRHDNDVDIVKGEAIVTSFEASSYTDFIDAKAYVGGYCGYNLFVANEDINKDDNYVFSLQNALKDKLNTVTSNSDKVNIVENIHDEDLNLEKQIISSNVVFVINGGISNYRSDNPQTISGEVCVGGLLGGDSLKTRLYVRNVSNIYNIIANEYVSSDILSDTSYDYLRNYMEINYSFAGGIVGRLNNATNLYNCANDSRATINSKGTYCGALCEINEGRIVMCKINSFGNNRDYVGGICGYNSSEGIIKKSYADNISISGRNVVGAVASVNNGFISKTKYNTIKIVAYGTDEQIDNKIIGVSGGLVGCNDELGYISILKYNGNIEINSKGSYVGGITGINYGSIKSGATMDSHAHINGYVIGLDNVGAVVGRNISDNNIRFINNYASVSSTGGDAGAIVSEHELGTIYHCRNYGNISSVQEGKAGGIAAHNLSEINSCINYGNVSSESGECGGIVGVNDIDSTVKKCNVYKNSSSDGSISNESVEIISSSNVGGIVGSNYGLIKSCTFDGTVNYINDLNITSSVGGIVGENHINGTIEKCYVGKNRDTLICAKKTSIANVGGIAGYNNGNVYDCNNELNKNKVDIVCSKGYAGGYIGFNDTNGSIKGKENKAIMSNSKWSIFSEADAGELYLGGIIGGYNSSLAVSNYENRAIVNAKLSHGNHNVYAGGIFGVILNTEESILLDNCKNIGSVHSGAYGAGIVSCVRNESTIFTNCINSGLIQGENIAGILSISENINDSGLVFENCINNGGLSCSKFNENSGCVTSSSDIYGNYVDKSFAVPTVHLEYTGDGNSVAVLDNSNLYKTDEKNTINIVNVQVDNNVTVIEPEIGYSRTPVAFVDNKDIVSISSYAKKVVNGKDFSKSSDSKSEHDFISDNKLNNKDFNIFETSFNEVYASQNGVITYNSILSNNSKNSSIIVNSELLVYDKDLKCNVSISNASSKIEKESQVEAIFDIETKKIYGCDKIQFNNYLWSIDDNSVLYGHVVASNIDKNSLTQIEDNEFYIVTNNKSVKSHTSIWEYDNKKNITGLKKGYIIRLQEDGKYTVIYSSLLAREGSYSSPQCYWKIYQYDDKSNCYISDNSIISLEID